MRHLVALLGVLLAVWPSPSDAGPCSSTGYLTAPANATTTQNVVFNIDTTSCLDGTVSFLWASSANASVAFSFSVAAPNATSSWFSNSSVGSYTIDPCKATMNDFRDSLFVGNLTHYGGNTSSDAIVPLRLGYHSRQFSDWVVTADDTDWFSIDGGFVSGSMNPPVFQSRVNYAYGRIDASQAFKAMFPNGTVVFPKAAETFSLFIDVNSTLWGRFSILPMSANMCMSSVPENNSIPFSGTIEIPFSNTTTYTFELPLATVGGSSNFTVNDAMWWYRFSVPLGTTDSFLLNSRMRLRFEFVFVMPPEQPPAGLSPGVIVGIAIGCACAVGVVGVLLYMFIPRKRPEGVTDRTPLFQGK